MRRRRRREAELGRPLGFPRREQLRPRPRPPVHGWTTPLTPPTHSTTQNPNPNSLSLSLSRTASTGRWVRWGRGGSKHGGDGREASSKWKRRGRRGGRRGETVTTRRGKKKRGENLTQVTASSSSGARAWPRRTGEATDRRRGKSGRGRWWVAALLGSWSPVFSFFLFSFFFLCECVSVVLVLQFSPAPRAARRLGWGV